MKATIQPIPLYLFGLLFVVSNLYASPLVAQGNSCDKPTFLASLFPFNNAEEALLFVPDYRNVECLETPANRIGGLGIVLIKPTRDEKFSSAKAWCGESESDPFVELQGLPKLSYKNGYVCEEYLTFTGFPRGFFIHFNDCPIRVVRNQQGLLTFSTPESCLERIRVVQ